MRSIDVAQRLREKHAELGLERQADMARMLGVTEATVSRIYSGKRNPGAVVVIRMLELWPDVFSADGGER